MESRRVFRSNYIVYPDLYYVWTYRPHSTWKYFYRHSEKYMYKKHICGIGYYSKYHARHVVGLKLTTKALKHIHVIKGSKLIEEGITTLPKHYNNRIYVNDPHTPDGSRKLCKWVYPPEFHYDKHRRRHFILYLVRVAEDEGPKAFNKKYRRYFNGYRPSLKVNAYLKRRRQIYYKYLQEYRQELGLPKEGIIYDRELLNSINPSKKDSQDL